MSKNYVKPNMVSYGACQTLIQGSCGWGRENITLDKTGYYRKEWRMKVAVGNQPCPGPDPNGNLDPSCKTVCRTITTCANKRQCI